MNGVASKIVVFDPYTKNTRFDTGLGTPLESTK
jgi:hypothetical protein